jgi:hypothetical protein
LQANGIRLSGGAIVDATLIEAQLSHVDPNQVRGACNHAEYVE